ncbi:MAG: class I SAM-dependent methyltransferase [Candidatus Moraniibacteriota bacterium]
MKWFEENPNKSEDIIDGLNTKYGNFDFKKSSRALYKKEFRDALHKLMTFSGKRIAIVGGNDGHETQYLKGKLKEVYVIDLAKDALRKVKRGIPIFASAEKLPFIDEFLDYYLAFRTLYSQHVDLDACLAEAKRILKKGGTLIISIPNGYLVDGKIQRGIFHYSSNSINQKIPYALLKKSIATLKSLGFNKIQFIDLPGEIIISANKLKKISPKKRK